MNACLDGRRQGFDLIENGVLASQSTYGGSDDAWGANLRSMAVQALYNTVCNRIVDFVAYRINRNCKSQIIEFDALCHRARAKKARCHYSIRLGDAHLSFEPGQPDDLCDQAFARACFPLLVDGKSSGPRLQTVRPPTIVVIKGTRHRRNN